jgi:hypothetical protein
MLCAMAVLLVGFMGIAIFTGLQGYIESDLQRASMNAALAGAAAYYSGTDGTGKPVPDPAQAKSIATSTFNNIVDNSSLKGFQATIQSVSSSDSNDSITVKSIARLGTPLLAPIGITLIETNATASARALSYEPTEFIKGNSLQLAPQAGDIASYSKVLDLTFPMVDGPGQDLYIEQDPALQQGYVVEGCNNSECYNLVPGATTVGTSRIATVNGVQVIYGTAIIDLAKAGVRKASKIRITHANANPFDYYDHGVGPTPLPATAQTLPFIKRIMIFGYAGACVKESVCPIPAGFVPIE